MTKLPTPVTFDYEVLDTNTRLAVQKATHEIQVALRTSARSIIVIGERLIEVKALVGHGHFEKWIDAEFEMSLRTAHRYIAAAEAFGDAFKGDTVSPTIAARAMYMLSAPSTPEAARQEAVDLASSGTRVTSTKAKQIIAAHKPAPVPALPAPAAPEPVATITTEPPATVTRLPDGRMRTADGVILRYVPGADRGWCSNCGTWSHFLLVGEDTWSCKTCNWRVQDDAIRLWEPEPAPPMRPLPTRPTSSSPFGDASKHGTDTLLADLQEAQRILRSWVFRLPVTSQTRNYIDMALVSVGKAITSTGKSADPLSNPFGKPAVQ